jgi:hypothetical protein
MRKIPQALEHRGTIKDMEEATRMKEEAEVKAHEWPSMRVMREDDDTIWRHHSGPSKAQKQIW